MFHQFLSIFLRFKLLAVLILQMLVYNEMRASENYTYAKLNFQLDPNIKYISGNVQYHFIANTSDTLTMNLASSMTVDSIIYHQQALTTFFFAPPDYFLIPLPQTSNGLDSIQVFYHGVPATTGLGSFKQDYHAGAPIISTLSQPYGASDWMPCINNLRDKVDSVDCFLTCPSAYTAVTNGVLVDTFSAAGFKTFHYQHRYPIATYLIGLAVSNFTYHQTTFTHDTLSFPLLNYTYPEDDANWMNGASQIGVVMHIFDSLFGAYPFAKEHYGMLQANLGGGMEHQTITFMKEYNNEVASHELGHQWFGDQVTCSNWHDLWINEGFATYMTGLVYENTENAYWWPIYLRDRMNKVMLEPDGSVYISDTTSTARMFDERLTYYKAAMVLHQLRYIMGDSAFFAACRNFLHHPLTTYGFASGQNLQSFFENASGLDLDYYFNQWIYGEGYPIYNIQCSNATNGTINVNINYITTTNTTTTFKLPVPITFVGASSDTVIYFPCENQSEQFTIQLPFTPQYFVCDSNHQIIAKSNATTGIPMTEKEDDFALYPTLTKGDLYISNFGMTMQYQILNEQMQVVCEGNLNAHQLNQVDVTSLASGLYYVRAINANRLRIEKFVKTN